MTNKRINLGGEEFFSKIISGERDFSNTQLYQIRIQDIKQLNDYLRKQDLENNPIILNGSVLGWVNLSQIYLPYLSAIKTQFNKCRLRGAVLKYSNLRAAYFHNTDLSRAEIDHAVLESATLIGCSLDKTILKFSNLNHAKLENCSGEELQLHGATYFVDGREITQVKNRASVQDLTHKLEQEVNNW